VPTVSFMIASLGGYAFHSFATGLGGVVQGTAQSSAGDAARGSFNAGQVNYRNVSAGTTSFGSFSGWTTGAFTTSTNQHQMDNITGRGGYMQMSGGSIDQARRIAWETSAYGGSKAGLVAFEWARRALENKGSVLNFEAARGQGVLGFTIIGEDGTSISYRPGEGGEGVLTITKNGKTLTTKVHSNGDIEGITTGKLSEGIVAMFGQSLAQSWAQELAQTQKDAELLSQLTQEANRISTAKELTKFYEKVKRAMGERRTEMSREALQRIADVIREYLQKDRSVTQGNQTGTTEIQTVQTGSSVGAGAQLGGNVQVGKKEGNSKNQNEVGLTGGGSAGAYVGVNYHAGETTAVQSQNTQYGKMEKTTRRGEEKAKSKENVETNAERESMAQASSDSTSVGTSYSVKYGSVQELMQAVSKTLQFSKERLESYKQTLQAANSVELRTALLPAVFNQLKEEEAKKLMEQGMSREDAYAKAAMNALARLDDMIEKSPKEVFKYLNSVSGLPDAKELKEKVEKNRPEEGTVGKPPPELKQQIEDAEGKLKGEYSLNAFVGNKRQADTLAKRLTQLTGRQAEVIKTGKGYMVSVGGFQSEDMAKGLAQGLGLKNYQVVKVEPQQNQPQPQQQPPTPAKR